ncbi:MAG: hypothetical protein M5T61_17555 [Acidimicrobiia bacterium]|nr:hypothetical protein [Acidimicrobiia bacterium]
MSVARRLDALEQSLTPTQRVIGWLEEAHAYGDMETYTRALIGQPPDAFPINRLCREAAQAARAAARGKSAEEINRAIRKELRETAFRYQLVMALNVAAHEQVDRVGLVHAALGGHVGVLPAPP